MIKVYVDEKIKENKTALESNILSFSIKHQKCQEHH